MSIPADEAVSDRYDPLAIGDLMAACQIAAAQEPCRQVSLTIVWEFRDLTFALNMRRQYHTLAAVAEVFA